MRWLVLLAGLAGLPACGNASSAPVADPADPVPPPPAPAYAGITRCSGPPPADPNLMGFAFDQATSTPMPRVELFDKDGAIARPIRARSAAFGECYYSLLARHPDAGGPVTATFTVTADGDIEDVEIAGFEPGLDACVCQVMLGVQFRPHDFARRTRVSYPFAFGPW
jgi:hypothetical protein